MAADFNPGVLTTKGLALLAKWQAGRCTPTITRAVAGSGSYSIGESIAGRTALKAQKLSVGLSTKKVENGSTLLVRFILDNTELTAGFKVTEVGLYATDPDDGEILYSIATTVDADNADYLPAYNGTYPSTIVFNYQVEVANASSVTIKGGTGAYALADDYYQTQADVEILQQQRSADAIAICLLSQHTSKQDDRLDALEAEDSAIQRHLAVESGSITLTNSKEYPFNSTVSTQVNVALATRRDNTDYLVETEVTAYSGGLPGNIEVSGKLTNSFKLAFTGSAKSVTVAYKVRGGTTV